MIPEAPISTERLRGSRHRVCEGADQCRAERHGQAKRGSMQAETAATPGQCQPGDAHQQFLQKRHSLYATRLQPLNNHVVSAGFPRRHN